jgi:hypothetical protein
MGTVVPLGAWVKGYLHLSAFTIMSNETTYSTFLMNKLYRVTRMVEPNNLKEPNEQSTNFVEERRSKINDINFFTWKGGMAGQRSATGPVQNAVQM